ncbi:hypothetical protein [Streptomyces sp. cf386]|uniref:hypothetical protein n=1 Tax=Streptomyces sp. cf386 TaxID=1761904 RepID=UPI00115FF864|nr:hypothetical protein [Streptomyces sp. cf386]
MSIVEAEQEVVPVAHLGDPVMPGCGVGQQFPQGRVVLDEPLLRSTVRVGIAQVVPYPRSAVVLDGVNVRAVYRWREIAEVRQREVGVSGEVGRRVRGLGCTWHRS